MEKLIELTTVGEMLKEEFIEAFGISQNALARAIFVPPNRISEIINNTRRITADTALRLSSYFGNSAKFWLGLQDDFDIEEENSTRTVVFERIKNRNSIQPAI